MPTPSSMTDAERKLLIKTARVIRFGRPHGDDYMEIENLIDAVERESEAVAEPKAETFREPTGWYLARADYGLNSFGQFKYRVQLGSHAGAEQVEGKGSTYREAWDRAVTGAGAFDADRGKR